MSVQKAIFSPLQIHQKFATSHIGQMLRVGWQWLYTRLWLALFLLAIPALWPFVQEGLPRSLDGGLHLLRLGVLDDLIRHGSLYPRWAPSLMLGYGYPVFNFYAPSTYYLTELLHLLGFSFYFSFMVTFALLILLAGFGMWLLALESFGPDQKWAALVAATAYLYAPYLLTNVYIRGALAETGAQALLPWIFWSVARLLRDRQPGRYCLPVALSLGGLALTHNITLLFLPPILLMYIGLQWWQGQRNLWTIGWAGLSLASAMGISAFFWLPLILERHYLADTAYEIATTVWLPGSVWTWGNFLDRGFTFTHTFARPIRLGLVQLGLAIAGFLAARRRDLGWLFWGMAALLISLMMTSWALPLWLSNDVLPVAQFAWRLLAILSLPLALLTGGLLLSFRSRWQSAVGGGILLLVIVLANLPRLSWMDVFAASSIDVGLPVFAQVEVDKGILEGGDGNPRSAYGA
ncbi:MAG: 6-pyruvoyl-tetrahydropterin synthase-related protein [Chloroflexi bacterium]|nr:6-pyruvoyl-tetrahydropterin synthase-related protein [Chloroflexota bacterium]